MVLSNLVELQSFSRFGLRKKWSVAVKKQEKRKENERKRKNLLLIKHRKTVDKEKDNVEIKDALLILLTIRSASDCSQQMLSTLCIHKLHSYHFV